MQSFEVSSTIQAVSCRIREYGYSSRKTQEEGETEGGRIASFGADVFVSIGHQRQARQLGLDRFSCAVQVRCRFCVALAHGHPCLESSDCCLIASTMLESGRLSERAIGVCSCCACMQGCAHPRVPGDNRSSACSANQRAVHCAALQRAWSALTSHSLPPAIA